MSETNVIHRILSCFLCRGSSHRIPSNDGRWIPYSFTAGNFILTENTASHSVTWFITLGPISIKAQ